jgi:hypothetical protein
MAYRHPAKRRRMRTIIQEMIMVPARILTGSGQLKLDIGSDLPGRTPSLLSISPWRRPRTNDPPLRRFGKQLSWDQGQPGFCKTSRTQGSV